MTPEDARAGLLGELVGSGALSAQWRAAFAEVARHWYLPDTIWRVDRSAGARLVPLRRDTEPARWLELAYRDAAVDTQVDDGHPAEDGTGWEVTSSASQPSVVATMLTALDVAPGMRVLEIGTGTGWNAALLAHRLGAENVTTIEIDTGVAERARSALRATGFGKVNVIIGDGTGGWTEAAPYDRVIATVGAGEVPCAWIAQTAPSGRVVAPLTNTYQAPGVVALRVRPDGTAAGRLAGPAAFMQLRHQRVPRSDSWDGVGGSGTETTTEIHPWHLTGDRDAAVAIGQRLGNGIHTHWQDTGPDSGHLWFLHPASRSWASLTLTPTRPYPVTQAGPRRLFDAVAAAHRWWHDRGAPRVEDWLVTVEPSGQRIAR